MKKAMIMSAGVGSRLEPLTNDLPKPLIPLANIPVMDYLLTRLEKSNISKVIANTHYHAKQIEDRYSKNPPVNVEFEYVRETELSGTAGGLKKCQFFFEDEDFFVMSADGVHNVDLDEVKKSHKSSGAIATMVLKEIDYDQTFMYGVVVRDKDGFITEFQEKPAPKDAKSNLVNTGIYAFNTKIFDYIPKNTFYDFAKNVFPSLLANNDKINTYLTKDYWNDIGTMEQYLQSSNDVFERLIDMRDTEVFKTETGKLIVGKNNKISNDIKIVGNCILGNNCEIKPNVQLVNSILWDDITVETGVEINNCVIASKNKIDNSITREIIGSNQTVTV